MAGFYRPFTTKIEGKPVIVYPCVGLEKVLSRDVSGSIANHLTTLYLQNTKFLSLGAYHIVILWDEGTDVMSDVWIFDKIDSWGSGPLADVKIFRNMELETGLGVSAGDGLLMLGREEELRRNAKSMEAYLNGTRAVLPEDIAAKEDFYA